MCIKTVHVKCEITIFLKKNNFVKINYLFSLSSSHGELVEITAESTMGI